MKWDTAGWLWLLVQQFPSFLFVCCSCFHVPARSMDSDQDMQETKATSEPHQSVVPIKTWWQRENRESKPCLMCVATEGEKKSRPCASNYLIPNFHKLNDVSTAALLCHTVPFAAVATFLSHRLNGFYLSIMKEQPVSCLCIFIVFTIFQRVVHRQINPE